MDEKQREALTDRGPKGSTVRRVTATADRARCEESCGTQPPPPSVLGKHQPKTSRREPGRRCPLRRIPRCRGCGEAAGDCVGTAAVFFDGFGRSRTARTGYASCIILGVCTPARSDGIEFQKREEEMNESRQTVAATKPVRRGGGGCGSRMLRRSVREYAAAAIGVQETPNPTSPGKEL